MICIRCQNDSKARERSNKRCPSCHGEFAFDRGDAFTDRAFQSAVDSVSAEGRIKWGVEHLYYELCRRKRRRGTRTPMLMTVAISLACVVIAIKAASWAFVLLAIAAAIAAFSWKWMLRKTVLVRKEEFEAIWSRWVSVHGEPKGRIVRRERTAKPRAAEADLGDYSFDRAVICDRARTVDLLLANNFHFENNCAVLSIAGYPLGPFETVRTMLKRNPKLQVFALHDASADGCRLAHRLAHDPAWFGGRVPVTDVGLRPAHREPFKGLFLPAGGGRIPPEDGITPEEAAWLTSYTLELAAIRPEQVLKRLFRAINRKDTKEVATSAGADSGSSSGDSVVDYDSSSFGSDASDSDGGADSFG